MIDFLRFALSSALLFSGLFILICSVYGIYKFKYVLNRMHAQAMGDTLGLMLCLLSIIVKSNDGFLTAKLFLIIAFLWSTSPVSSHLVARLEINTNPIWKEDIISAHEFISREDDKNGLL